MSNITINIKRVYDTPSEDDGIRIFVDRLWPRGMKKNALIMHAWIKELAPSPQLRIWFGHDPGRFKEFKKKYFEELEENKRLWQPLLNQYTQSTITLLYAAKDPNINHARCLQDYLTRHLGSISFLS